MESDRQRLDKWIWFARVVKSRTVAARLVEAGHVRVNGQRAAACAKPVAIGDVLTISLDREVKVLGVVGLGERRGPYNEARLLYRDMSEQNSSVDLQELASLALRARSE